LILDARATNEREELANACLADTDWVALSTAARIRFLELEGYLVLPDLLSADQLAAIREELNGLPTQRSDYSEFQRGFAGELIAEDVPSSIATIAHPDTTGFLGRLFGDSLICTSIRYALSLPGHPGIAVHTDAQPYGSKIFGLQSSSPCLVRVLYYLDDLTLERAPFKVIPRSHLSLHADGNPYRRYLRHPDEVMVTCKAGSAVIINQQVFHGNFPNYSDDPRRMLAVAYRPAWAGPIGEITERNAADVGRQPESVRQYLGSLNTAGIEYDLPNRPDNLAIDAPGISRDRWRD
jgi:ectoine hydroxylase-related dioxygenase (phytanoyl-CoA dioxygenase family)